MAREDVYIAQLQELGVWNEAFRPMVKDLAKAERRRTRAEKEWAATVPKGGKPSFTHPLYQACVQLDRTVMEYREALGLTPKALKKLRGQGPAGPSEQELITASLDRIAARVGSYASAPALPTPEAAYAAAVAQEWADLVSDMDTQAKEET